MEDTIKNKSNILRMDRELLEEIVHLRIGLETNIYSIEELRNLTEALIESVEDKLIQSGIINLVNIGKGFEKYTNKIMKGLTTDETAESKDIIKSINLLGRSLRMLEAGIVYECIISENIGEFKWMGYEVVQRGNVVRHYDVLGTNRLEGKYRKTINLLVTLVHHSGELVSRIRRDKNEEEEVEYLKYLRSKLPEILNELSEDESIKTNSVDNMLNIKWRLGNIIAETDPRRNKLWLREINRKAREILVKLEIGNRKSASDKRHTNIFEI